MQYGCLRAGALQPEKKFNGVIDYSKYSHRPLKDYQIPAVEKLMTYDKFILADDMGVGKTTPEL